MLSLAIVYISDAVEMLHSEKPGCPNGPQGKQ